MRTGDEMLGSLSNEMTLRRMVRTLCVGFHRSSGRSPDCASSPGGCRMEMQILPSCTTRRSTISAPHEQQASGPDVQHTLEQARVSRQCRVRRSRSARRGVVGRRCWQALLTG